MTEFKVGQTLYYVPEHRNGRLVTIEKVGRQWLTIERRIRVSKETLRVDGKGYSTPGQCWLSEEDYIQYTELRRAWNEFRNKVKYFDYRVPDGVTMEKINQVFAILFNKGE